jgi:transcriptional regulator with XRE-family HTH domain
MAMDGSMGARLQRLRAERGVTLSELARKSGVGKGTISELERDLRGARLETLFALTTALEAPLGTLLADDRDAAAPEAVSGASVAAILLGRWRDAPWLVEAYRAEVTGDRQQSPAHASGVEETVTVVRGRVLAGPVGDEREVGEGESRRYPANSPHLFRAVGRTAQIILLMHYPDHDGKDPHDVP